VPEGRDVEHFNSAGYRNVERGLRVGNREAVKVRSAGGWECSTVRQRDPTDDALQPQPWGLARVGSYSRMARVGLSRFDGQSVRRIRAFGATRLEGKYTGHVITTFTIAVSSGVLLHVRSRATFGYHHKGVVEQRLLMTISRYGEAVSVRLPRACRGKDG
jgi:hypothetical protein